MPSEMNVGTPCAAYRKMDERWQLLRALLGGTIEMRRQAQRYLPMEPRERPEDYLVRLERSILYGAFADTIETLTAKPYSKNITIQGELPELLQPILEDADLAGQPFQQMARGSFSKAVTFGLDHYLVDRAIDAAGATYADQKAGRVRSAIVHLPAENLIGWRATRVKGRGYRLTQVRIRECVEVDSGDYDTEPVEQILVLNAPAEGGPGTWRRFQFRKDAAGSNATWMEVGNGALTWPGGIPLVTWYTKRTGFLTAAPPLEDLAWLNLRHWQSYSDQSNILRFSRFHQVAKTGITQDEYENPKNDTGPNRELLSTNPAAKFYVVEPGGTGMEAGFQDLKTLEDRMEALGQQPMIERVGDATATGVMASQGKTMTTIQSWIRNQENALEQAFRIAAELDGVELDEDFGVDIFSDFAARSGDPAQAQIIVQMRAAGDIDQETELRELVRRGVLQDDTDVESVIEKTKSEGPSLSLIGAAMRQGASNSDSPSGADSSGAEGETKDAPMGEPKPPAARKPAPAGAAA